MDTIITIFGLVRTLVFVAGLGTSLFGLMNFVLAMGNQGGNQKTVAMIEIAAGGLMAFAAAPIITAIISQLQSV